MPSTKRTRGVAPDVERTYPSLAHLNNAAVSTRLPSGRKGLRPLTPEEPTPELVWHVEDGPGKNYRKLGLELTLGGDLYRNGSHGLGLLQVLPDGTTRPLVKGPDLAPAVADRINMVVMKNGRFTGDLPPANHLNAMLRAESFLSCFPPVDAVVATTFYCDDYTLIQPGYHDGGERKRVLYVGPRPEVATDSMTTIHAFLDQMDFASNADRTNAIAAALTVLLRELWPGEKPVLVITATKSHAGKGTIMDFARGGVAKCDLLYESLDWPMHVAFQRQVRQDPDLGVVIFDNVRLDSAGGRGKCIRSAFIESFVTNPELNLSAPGGGDAMRLKNRYVVVINTNDGSLSRDLLNRALSIHLEPKGDVHDRQSKIGNPKLEFLPRNRAVIDAELRGMIERWRVAGCPLDEIVTHSMSPWAKVIGGILKHNGFSDFLANQWARRIDDDPRRRAVGLLGVAAPGDALTPKEWSRIMVQQGLEKLLIDSNDRGTDAGRERGVGVVLKPMIGETFEVSAAGKLYTLKLEGGNRRWTAGSNGHVRYKFEVLDVRDLPLDE